MKKYFILYTLLFFSINLHAQPNCNVYKNNNACYESCLEALKAIRHKQGSFQSQQHFDRSIELCDFAYSYQQKSVPFLKRGNFIEWKRLIDKAVELSPQEYLGYRGWCRLQFLRDYEGAIADIERLKSLTKYDIGYCQTSEYHLNIALALCYKEIGEIDKARTLFEAHINSEELPVGNYDFYHFGVLEYEAGNYEIAIEYLEKQIEINDYLGEAYYFVAMAAKKLGQTDKYREQLQIAAQYYQNGKFRTDTYAEMIDKIYLVDIIKEISSEASGGF